MYSVALVEAQLILAQVFFNFDVELSPESSRWLDVQWAHMVCSRPFHHPPKGGIQTRQRHVQALQIEHAADTHAGMGETGLGRQVDCEVMMVMAALGMR